MGSATNMKNKLHNYIFLSLTVLTICFYFMSSSKAEKLEEKYKQEQAMYQLANQVIQTGENIEQAPEYLKDLDNDNFLVRRTRGLAYAINNNFDTAIVEYQVALDLAPKLAMNPIFMVQFAEFHYFINQYEESLNILLMAQQYDTQSQPEVTERIATLITELQSVTKGEGENE